MKAAQALMLAAGMLIVCSHAPSALAQCEVPPQYTNTTTLTAGDLIFVMGTDRNLYSVGDSVQFYLSVYNAGPDTVVIPNPGQVSAIHSWDVLPDSCESRYEPEGCEYDTPFWSPQGIFFFGIPLTLPPGACVVRTVTWDGVHWAAGLGRTVVPAVYNVVGGYLAGWDGQTTSQGAPLVPMEVQIEITDGVSTVPTTWSGIKAGVR